MRRVFRNAEIYTGTGRTASAMAVEDGRILFVGSEEELRESGFANGAEETDLSGAFVSPGFIDSHMHVLNFGTALRSVNLSHATDSLEHMQQAVRDFIAEGGYAPGSWIFGRGWNQDYFAQGVQFPTAKDLDAISAEHPICLVRACGHVCAANTLAMRLAGVTAKTPQPDGGCYETDEDGNPNGIFRENAIDLIRGKIPQPDVEELKDRIAAGCQALNAYGVTSCQTDDFSAFPAIGFEPVLQAFQELEAEGRLTVKVYEQCYMEDEKSLERFLEKGYRTGDGSRRFRIGPVKLIGDGSLGARTAWMRTPYADDPSTCGMGIYTAEQMERMIGLAHRSGMQIAVHCIGDACLEQVLGAYEKALAEKPVSDHRHGIVHCQITGPEQLARFEDLGLHAYIQSIFLDYDIQIVEERVGKVRAASSYAFRTLYENGAKASNGSDCPVELPDVLNGIQCAVTRKNLAQTVGPYRPEEALSVEEALQSYTVNGAFASFEENEKGKIEPGMAADFVVLSASPFRTDPEKIGQLSVLSTWVDGACVYQA